MYKKVDFGPTKTYVKQEQDGTLHYYNQQKLAKYPVKITDKLAFWSEHQPEKTLLASKEKGQWKALSYEQAWMQTKAVASYLTSFDFNKDDVIVILSENSIEHALLALAALHVGVVYSPISPAYSLVSDDLAKLKHCLQLLKPKIVFAQSSNTYSRALALCRKLLPDVIIITADKSVNTHFKELLETSISIKMKSVAEKVTGDTNAKILFTSGSTGLPKGVINHHEMWCANLQQISQMFPFMQREAPVFIDWLPWNHTFGGNHNLGLALYHGGSFFIDKGKPNSVDILKTIENLHEISPTSYFNVPKGFEMLIPYLENDKILRQKFFKNLKMMFYAGASLAQPIWEKLEALSLETTGYKIPVISGFGSTESGPSAMFANWSGGFSGLLGIPVAGMDMKLVPNGDKFQAGYKAPNLTKGYWKDSDANKIAFDSEGYFLTGDAVRFLDNQQPDKGLVFDGRITEDFKLATGTWVNVGVIRSKALQLGAPVIQDIVVAGINEDYIAAILFLNEQACNSLFGKSVKSQNTNLIQEKRGFLDEWLHNFNKTSSGSSTYIKKYVIAEKPLSMTLGELTDKGSVNQRVVLKNREALVKKLYTS